MKWSKNWVAAVMLLPAMYLVSCGSGNNDGETTDTLSTQSAPPSSDNSTSDLSSSTTTDTSTSLRSSGTDATGSAATGTTPESAKTGSTAATGNTGTASGNTGLSSSERTGVTAATGETKRSRTTGTKSRTYRKSSGTAKKTTTSGDRSITDDRTTTERSTTTQDTTTSVDRTLDTAANRVREIGDTAANKMGELADSTARKIGRLGDTLATRADELGDTTAQNIDRLGDTAANRLREMGDTSTMSRSKWDTTSTTEFDSTKGKQGNISGMTEKERTGNFKDTTDPQTGDSSRTMSTMGAGIDFTSSVFIPDQIRSNYAEIKLARMAIDKSQSEGVKQIARTLENDHNASLRELQTLARNSSTGTDTLPTSENEMARHHMDMLKDLTGQEFDRQWLQHMHMMHDQKVRIFEQAETNNSIQDAQLRIWVNKTLPTLRKHRDMLAQELNSQNR